MARRSWEAPFEAEALPYFEKARRHDSRLLMRGHADVLDALCRLSEASELASQSGDG